MLWFQCGYTCKCLLYQEPFRRIQTRTGCLPRNHHTTYLHHQHRIHRRMMKPSLNHLLPMQPCLTQQHLIRHCHPHHMHTVPESMQPPSRKDLFLNPPHFLLPVQLLQFHLPVPALKNHISAVPCWCCHHCFQHGLYYHVHHRLQE